MFFNDKTSISNTHNFYYIMRCVCQRTLEAFNRIIISPQIRSPNLSSFIMLLYVITIYIYNHAFHTNAFINPAVISHVA